MKFQNLSLLLFLNLIPSIAIGSGYQIPNQSVVAMGIAGAHIAYTPGPDSAYFNPANMSYLSDSWKMEGSLTALYISPINYIDNRSALLNGSSQSELYFLPQIHITSRDLNKFRIGFSITHPYGLAKRWEQPFPAATAKSYKLFVIEGNPCFSYQWSEKLSIGAGLRIIYGDGEVKTSLLDSPLVPISPISSISSNIEGDDTQVGYNLAVTLRPIKKLNLAATYKSKMELDLEGDAFLQALAGPVSLMNYRGSGKLSIILPATFSLASSYTFNDVTFEITWSRTFWSSFKQLDFQFDQSFLGTPFDGFDRVKLKNWDDSDALRFGLTYRFSPSVKTTFGFAYDKNPAPESTLGFELPDSDALMYSAGLQYKTTKRLTLGISYSYQSMTSRSITNEGGNVMPGIDGVFKDGEAHAVTAGVIYEF